jgi:hypothetical protein
MMLGNRLNWEGIGFCGLVAALLAAVLVSAGAAATPAQASCGAIASSNRSVARNYPARLKGQVCGSVSSVSVQRKTAGSTSWRTISTRSVASDGSFRACGKVKGAAGTTNKFRAVSAAGGTPVVRVRVKSSGSSSCSIPTTTPTTTDTGSTGGSPSTGSCPLATPGSTIGLTVAGCTRVASDTASNSDPLPFWGSIECASSARHKWSSSGGDTHLDATGASQGNGAYRKLTAIDGDDFYGERCELGKNEHRNGPVDFYHEGERKATFLSVKLPDNLSLSTTSWQVVMQMKQAQPANNGGGTPILAMEARDGRWRLMQSDSAGPSSNDHEIWSAPAANGVWTRFAFDIVYSRDASKGSIRVYADLNGDGDVADAGEQSTTIKTYTLKYETSGSVSTDLSPGQSIPSHLRTGLYHNPSISCPAPAGCSVDVDNVQVLSS